MKKTLLVLVLTGVLSLLCLGQRHVAAQDELDQIVPRHGFLLSNVANVRRGGIDRYDPVEALMVRDGLASLQPKDGQTFDLGNGEQRHWEAVELDENGAIDRQSLGRGAYLYIPINVDSERVMVLNAASHDGLFLNGIPHTSNVYGYAYYHIPVRLKAGHNGLLLRAGRQGIKAKLYEPPSSTFLLQGDQTLPDLIIGQATDAWAAVIVVNATSHEVQHLSLVSHGDELNRVVTRLPPLPALSIRKVGFRIRGPAVAASDQPVRAQLELFVDPDQDPVHATPLELRRRSAHDAHKRTFVSKIDGSVQYFGLRPALATAEDDAVPALVLSCHGASVEGIGQAAAYAPKSWLHLVAPTNRRPYGFDWEDLGRADAIEVLELAMQVLKHDPARTYLTGHSMGGHGAWHLGSLFPDKFAAIGPSAGWISYTSYARRRQRAEAEVSPLQELLQRGQIIGDPTQLALNLKNHGVYILHGADDDNVPATQARRMADLLTDTHKDWVYHEEPGKKHWWSNELDDGGATCMDWPGMYDFFARHALPSKQSVRTVEFATANPGVSSTCYWLGIEAQLRHQKVSQAKVHTWPNKRRFQGTTDNVAVLKLAVDHLTSPGPISVELDGQPLDEVPFPLVARQIWLGRENGNWRFIDAPHRSQKGSHRYGSTKNELRHRFLFVVGTGGDEQENVWTLAKASLDAETLWYRGNGSVDMIADSAFEAQEYIDRTVVLYGNADTNSAWPELLSESPVQVHAGMIKAGNHQVTGSDLACLFVQPRHDSDNASVISISASGVTGMRLACKQSLFRPFVRYPDCVILRAPPIGNDRATVELAGYFGLDWSVENGEFIASSLASAR